MNTLNRLEFRTSRLPINFRMLGYMLLALAIWRTIVLDWMGIVYLAISLFLLFFRTAVIIDAQALKIKQYVGLFLIKKGKWERIEHVSSIQLTKTKETQTMSVLSISRIETTDTYILYIIMPSRNIKLMQGNKAELVTKGNTLAALLKTSFKDTTL
jgi:hypothetical protein